MKKVPTRKVCKKCNTEKRISDFCHSGKYYHSYCRMCLKKYRRNYKKSLTKEQLKRYQETDKQYQKNKRALGLVNKTEEYNYWRKQNPNAANAHQKVYQYIKKGKLQRQPCKICGEQNAYGHHQDYSRPLAILWLCASCHKKWHLKLVGKKLLTLKN